MCASVNRSTDWEAVRDQYQHLKPREEPCLETLSDSRAISGPQVRRSTEARTWSDTRRLWESLSVPAVGTNICLEREPTCERRSHTDGSSTVLPHLISGQFVEHYKLPFLQRIQPAASPHFLRQIHAHSPVAPVRGLRLSSAAMGFEQIQ